MHDLWRPLVFAGHLCGEVVLDEAVRFAPDHVVSQSQSFHALNANLKDVLHWRHTKHARYMHQQSSQQLRPASVEPILSDTVRSHSRHLQLVEALVITATNTVP